MCAEFSKANRNVEPPVVSRVSNDDPLSPLSTSLTNSLEHLNSRQLNNLETNLRGLQRIIESFQAHIGALICNPLDAALNEQGGDFPISPESLRRAYEFLSEFTLQAQRYGSIVPFIGATMQVIEGGIRENLENLTTLKNESSVDTAKLHHISQTTRKYLSQDTEKLTSQIHKLLGNIQLCRKRSSIDSEGLV